MNRPSTRVKKPAPRKQRYQAEVDYDDSETPPEEILKWQYAGASDRSDADDAWLDRMVERSVHRFW